MFKVNTKDTRTTSMSRSDVFSDNFKHISHLFSTASITEFEQVLLACLLGY